jgi:hypothetical protein
MSLSSPVARIRAQELKKIADKHGGKLVPADVVKAAENPKSPLHDAFTWDDGEAAALWRLEEARTLIREVRVQVTINSVRHAAPVYVSDPDPERSQPAYVALDAASRREDDAERVLNDEFTRIEAAIKRGKTVAAVLGLEEELEGLLLALVGARDRVALKTRRTRPESEDQPSA